MKKLFYSMMAVAIAVSTFTSCEDVPEPYNNPYNYTPAEVVEPKGTGTQADPFNVAAALEKCQEVGTDGTTEDVYAVGYVVSISELSTQYGNATFMIADSKEGGDMLTVYRAKGPGNQNITDENLIKTGDKVLICGKLVNFKGNTPEFTQGCYIVSINDAGGEEPGGDKTVGTKENPKTVAEALAAINALETENKDTEESWYIKGKVKQVITTDENITKYKNIDYIISDDGSNELKVFRGKYIDNADFTLENKVKIDDEVIILGKLQKYVKDGNTTPEVTNSAVVVHNSGGVTPPTPSDFEAGKYLFVYNQNGTYKVGTPVASDKDYGYMLFADAKITEGKLDNDEANLFTFTATEGGFTIQDASNRYYYMDGEHKSFQVSATMPQSNFVWTVATTTDGTATIKNTGTGMTIQYVAKYNEFTATDSGDGLPLLLKPGSAVDGQGGGDPDPGTGGGEGTKAAKSVTDNVITLTNSSATESSDVVTVDFNEQGFTDKAAATTVTLGDGTTIAFGKGENTTNAPAFYSATKGVRVYAKNTITINGKSAVAKVVMTCDVYNNTTYIGNEMLYGSINGNQFTIVNDHTEAKGGVQLRVQTMTITYAQ